MSPGYAEKAFSRIPQKEMESYNDHLQAVEFRYHHLILCTKRYSLARIYLGGLDEFLRNFYHCLERQQAVGTYG